MKIEVINSRIFAVDDNKYQRGDFYVDYRNQAVRIIQKETGLELKQGAGYVKWQNFRDSGNAPYANYEAFVTALSTILATADAETTIANDKGTVTQITSKTTAVTANVLNGVVTTVALTDAADTSFNFTVNNSKVTATSNVQLTGIYAGATGDVKVSLVSVSAGAFVVKVSNVGVAVLNAVAKVGFVVNG